MNRFRWNKDVVKKEKPKKQKFSATSPRPPKHSILSRVNSHGVPDVQEMRQEIKEKMKRFRRGV